MRLDEAGPASASTLTFSDQSQVQTQPVHLLRRLLGWDWYGGYGYAYPGYSYYGYGGYPGYGWYGGYPNYSYYGYGGYPGYGWYGGYPSYGYYGYGYPGYGWYGGYPSYGYYGYGGYPGYGYGGYPGYGYYGYGYPSYGYGYSSVSLSSDPQPRTVPRDGYLVSLPRQTTGSVLPIPADATHSQSAPAIVPTNYTYRAYGE